MRAVRRSILILGTALVASALAACDPPPPRLQLVVTSTADTDDTNPGDGLCRAWFTSGGCTLRAAVQEANAAPHGAEILVPSNRYQLDGGQEVTGDVIIRRSGSGLVELNGSFTVEVGGVLRLDGINTASNSRDLPYLAVEVRGSAVAVGSWVSVMRVAAGGTAVLASSIVGGSPPLWAIENSGTLVSVGSSILGDMDATEPDVSLVTRPGGVTKLSSTVVAGPQFYLFGGPWVPGFQSGCGGEPPVSSGYVHVEVPCGGDLGVGDGSGPAGTFIERFVGGTPLNSYLYGFTHGIAADSPLIDAVPIGEPGCEVGAVDFYGNPRGVDGDGDGIGGCDIGAIERQP